MAHPAASIKSIFSGRVNLTPDDLDPFEYSDLDNSNDGSSRVSGYDDSGNGETNVNNGNNPAIRKHRKQHHKTHNEDEIEDDSNSNYSVTSSNLRQLSQSYADDSIPQVNINKPFPQIKAGYVNAGHNNNESSTNISLASTESDYQREYTDDNVDYLANSETPNGPPLADTPPPDYLVPNDPFTRSLSRNSTTSCLSTTATKDGIEGKRLHRHGPTPYSSNIISNMIHSQQQQQQQQRALNAQSKSLKSTLANSSSHQNSINATDLRVSTTDSIQDNDASECSVVTTQAAIDSEYGSGGHRYFEDRLPADYKMPPPITLKEKINLLNTDTITSEK
ncbi:uncharacterized protein RJT21DRAFT_34602 [Scheffersomyces amazonensis]|uniref:uncharacterized protein n=1 Tax=Scheffersomyces amazonensis TaxID=1078765 RepID=UPI00315DC958